MSSSSPGVEAVSNVTSNAFATGNMWLELVMRNSRKRGVVFGHCLAPAQDSEWHGRAIRPYTPSSRDSFSQAVAIVLQNLCI